MIHRGGGDYDVAVKDADRTPAAYVRGEGGRTHGGPVVALRAAEALLTRMDGRDGGKAYPAPTMKAARERYGPWRPRPDCPDCKAGIKHVH